ncbi:MAG: Hsp70 family protein [Bacteroidetes bacterium]|nr:Hsp70 family protein [Bacteroidota bacterium]
MKQNDFIVGIDLGTTNSVVSILEKKLPRTLMVDNEKLLPSVLSLTDDGFIVGKVAKNMAVLEPHKTVASIKRRMGENISIPIGNKQLRPEEISAIILKKIKQEVINHFKLPAESVIRSVVTVPAYFTEEQREATKQAAELAGLKVERIINEPTAAALAFGLSKMEEALYAVYDFGGGAFDVSVIESDEGVVEVLASSGNNHLGGDDLDKILADHIGKEFLRKNKLSNFKWSAKEEARLLRVAEQTKIKLSTDSKVDIQENFFFSKDNNHYHLEISISRAEFEELIHEKILETVQHLKKAVEEADVTIDELDGAILVGGSSRIPLVSNLIEKELGISPMLIDLPDEAVSHGATIQGAIITGQTVDVVLVDITPRSLGIAVASDDYFLSLLGGLQNRDFDSDLKAAVIVSKNTPIPVRKTNKFSATVPYQKGYQIQIFQGEEERFVDNNDIGEMHLEVKSPVENGEIDVTFELDINGILHIHAIETTTKENVKGQFESSRGKKIKKSQLEESMLLTMDEAESTLLKRAEKVLEEKELNDEDKNELESLIKTYKNHQLTGEKEKTSETETELLDLLYYLEGDEN